LLKVHISGLSLKVVRLNFAANWERRDFSAKIKVVRAQTLLTILFN
jgi:hypothetical protein